MGPAGRRYRSIAARPAPQQHGAAARRAAANAGSATFSACVCVAIHRLVSVIERLFKKNKICLLMFVTVVICKISSS